MFAGASMDAVVSNGSHSRNPSPIILSSVLQAMRQDIRGMHLDMLKQFHQAQVSSTQWGVLTASAIRHGVCYHNLDLACCLHQPACLLHLCKVGLLGLTGRPHTRALSQMKQKLRVD